MAFNLGIDIGPTQTHAAVERDGAIRVLTLGRHRAMASAVHVSASGAVTIGDAALEAAEHDQAGLVADVAGVLAQPASRVVNGWTVNADVLVAHLLTFVLQRALDGEGGESLGALALSVPTIGPQTVATATAATTRAGVAELDVVDASTAIARAPEAARADTALAPAVGAAVTAGKRHRAALAGSAAAGAAAYAAVAAAATAPPATGVAPATVVSPSAAPSAGPAGPGAFGGGDDEPFDNRRRNLVYGAAVAALLLAIGVVVVLLLARRGDDTAVDTGQGSTTSGAPGTSAASSTSSTSASTTTVPATTAPTTTKAGATTTTAAASTTVTLRPPPTSIGKVALTEYGLVLNYNKAQETTLQFGDDAQRTLDKLTAVLGSPTKDAGWKKADTCDGSEARRVSFGDLEVVFTKGAVETDPSSRTFQQWFVGGEGATPAGLLTLEKIGVGSTMVDLKRAFPKLKVIQPVKGDPAGEFFTNPEGESVSGVTNNTSDRAFVLQLWAGTACQRVFE